VPICPLLDGRASSMARLKTARAPEVSGGNWRRAPRSPPFAAGVGQGHPEGLCGRGILLVQQPEQQVIGTEPAVAAAACLLSG